MSDVSYPVPIRDVIIGGKTWGNCQLADMFRRARLKLMPDPPVVGFLEDKRPIKNPENIKNEVIDAVMDWAASSRMEQQYSPDLKRLHALFDYYRHFRFKFLYLYTDNQNNLSHYAQNEFWAPEVVERSLDLHSDENIYQVLVALDLTKSFDSQIRTVIKDPSTFTNWQALRATPIDCISPEKIGSTPYKNEEPKISSLYQRLESIFINRQEAKHKTIFVFIDGYAELSFGFVENHLHDWTEHDRMVKERGGGFAIMAFDLNRPFRDQFPPYKYGQFNEGNREGLSYFCVKPLINIPDRTGTKIPAEEERKAHHIKVLRHRPEAVWSNPDVDEISFIRKSNKPELRPVT